MKIKKIRNYSLHYLKIFTILFLRVFFKRTSFQTEDLGFKNFMSRFKYINNKFGFIKQPTKNKFDKLLIDSSLTYSDLCDLGKVYGTDKSPYNEILHRHPYTGFYDLIFASQRKLQINFAEIGILDNKSINCWRKYFLKAKIFAFEYDKKMIVNAKKDNLNDVFYNQIDVKNKDSIKLAFKKTKVVFDIIIDDSTHDFEDQIRIIKTAHSFLKKGGILIIEDIPNNNDEFSELNFYKRLHPVKNLFSTIKFIDCEHINKFSKGWSNDKILFLIKD